MATASDFVPQNPPTHQLEVFSNPNKVFNVGTFQEGLALNKVHGCWWFRNRKQPPGMYKTQ